MSFRVFPELALPPGLWSVEVRNLQGASAARDMVTPSPLVGYRVVP
jgi:hypothetical protein